jgi:serine/threonine protein kinase
MDESRTYLHQLLKVVSYLESIGIAHCDLKPDNIIIDNERNELKVIDFNQAVIF